MLTENHKRYLLNAFHHIDTILAESADKLVASSDHRLFPAYRQDATATQQKILRDYLDNLRFVLQRFMERHELVVPLPNVSTLKAFTTSVMFARIAADELRPEYLRGYGELAPEDEGEMLQFVAELYAALQRIRDYLRSGDGGDLATRLERLANTTNEASLLVELGAVVERHGLVEFRGRVTDIAARLESPRYDIAFFGPVSAGKSSLLNAIIGQQILPVGVTPVTSVVTRLRYGDAARMRVTFASEPAVEAAIENVAEYVTETMNPANAKHVLDVDLELPSALLKRGVHLIDTPGLGSLAVAGAVQTLAYLPRCDLGVMLVDGVGRISRDDVAIARFVVDAGSELVLVLSKADLMNDGDRQTQIEYVQKQFSDALGFPILVAPVSAADRRRDLLDRWIETELSPRLERLRDLTMVSLRRKINVLRESVVASLQARMDSASLPAQHTAHAGDSMDSFAAVRAQIETTRAELNDVCLALSRAAPTLLDRAVVSASDGSTAAGGTAEVIAHVVQSLNRVADTLHQQLDAARTAADDAVRNANQTAGATRIANVSLPAPAGCPLFDPGALTSSNPVEEPFWTLGTIAIRRAWLRRALHRQWDSVLRDGLTAYSDALRRWSGRYLDNLAREFDSEAAPLESRLRMSNAGRDAAEQSDSAIIQEDVARLSNWSSSQS